MAGQERSEHTLKMWRVPLRSDFRAAIATASASAWRSRETEFLPLRLMAFLCISATVLQSRARLVGGVETCIGGSTHVIN